jgi:hypothetical protein
VSRHVFEQIESGERIGRARMAPQRLEVCVVAGVVVPDRQVQRPVVFRVQPRERGCLNFLSSDGQRAELSVGRGTAEYPRRVVFVITDAATQCPLQAVVLAC